MNDTILGIIGGMGPEATVTFYNRIIKHTTVNKDQDHFRIIIDSNSKIPDRTDAILNNAASPLPALIETVKNLERAGVQVAAIPCITAHYFIEELNKNTSIEIIHAFKEMNKVILTKHSSLKKIGILTTSGTISTKLFNKFMPDLEILYPDNDSQNNEVMESIYGDNGIKKIGPTKYNTNLILSAGNKLIKKGAEIIIAGCTELGIVLKNDSFSVILIDPLDILAESLINYEKTSK